MSQLFVRTGVDFASRQQLLAHIGEEMLAKGVVHESYPAALLAREENYPTGIAWSVMGSPFPTARRATPSPRRSI